MLAVLGFSVFAECLIKKIMDSIGERNLADRTAIWIEPVAPRFAVVLFCAMTLVHWPSASCAVQICWFTIVSAEGKKTDGISNMAC